jgi:hypothetical protein
MYPDMNKADIIEQSLKSIEKARGKNTGYEVYYEDKDRFDHPHEFLFFIKPEITQLIDQSRLAAVLDMTLDKISDFSLHIRDIRMLAASYLKKYDIIAQHYGVINSLSRLPLKFLSAESRSKFREIFKKEPEDTKMLGSLQFLKQFPACSPDTLEKLWHNVEAVKLGGGTYCARVTYEGENIFLINGFHPNQLMHFTAEGRCIVAFTLTGKLDWSIARNRFIGKTNPADALAGSLRNDLLAGIQSFGLTEVSSSQNGFHLSAGPVEGLVELMRYCSNLAKDDRKKPGDFIFGKKLEANFTAEETNRICSNQLVEFKGKKISSFDLTEEKNGEEALRLLKEGRFL